LESIYRVLALMRFRAAFPARNSIKFLSCELIFASRRVSLFVRLLPFRDASQESFAPTALSLGRDGGSKGVARPVVWAAPSSHEIKLVFSETVFAIQRVILAVE
jgi:hypothetical protein